MFTYSSLNNPFVQQRLMEISTPPVPVLDLSPEIESLWDEFNEAFERVLRSGRFIMGPEVKAFETEAAEYLGVKHAVGVNSGTVALLIALRALGVGPGDEVITTPFSFFATAESISIVGATPVFADVEAESFNIDPEVIEAKITPRTKALLPVHLYGNPAAMTQIMALARKHDLVVVEDCAQSFGARYYGTAPAGGNRSVAVAEGKHAGTIGHAGAYSFFPSKNLGAFGDGGLIVTGDDEMAALAAMLRTHGAKKKYHNEVLGYNSRLDALQAAMLRVKLPHIDEFNEGRRRVARTYNALLAEVPGIIPPKLTEGHVFHQYTIRVLEGKRERVRERLAEEEISTMVYYPYRRTGCRSTPASIRRFR